MTDTVYIVTVFENRQRRQDESIKFYDNYKVDNEIRLLRTRSKKRLDQLLALVEKYECAYSVFNVNLGVTFDGGVYVTTRGRAYQPDNYGYNAELDYKFFRGA